MNNITINAPQKRYGVTERKKAELDLLEEEVRNAEYTVQQFEAMVTSLTEKSNKFTALLQTADAKRATALSNWDLAQDVLKNLTDLKNSSEIALEEMSETDVKVDDLTKNLTQMIKELIYSAEMIEKLSNLVIRRKAQNPLISDELITILGTAGQDANNAVAATLVALKSTYTTQSSNKETEAISSLEFMQAVNLLEVYTGTDSDGKATESQEASLFYLIHKAYQEAEKNYEKAQDANTLTAKQLNEAQSNLEKAQVKLTSLQSGYAAANAAALAS